jgi:hypothetical protein
MSITGKIRFGLGVLLAFLVAAFLLGQYLDRQIQSNVDTAITKNFAAAEQLAELGVSAQQIRRYEKEYFIYVNDEAGRAKYRKEWTGTYDKLRAQLNSMVENKNKTFGPQDAQAFLDWSAALEFYGTEFNKIMIKGDAGQIVPAVVVEDPKVGKTGTPAAPVVAPVVAPDVSRATKIANDMIGPGKDRLRTLLDGADKMRKAKIAESATSVTEIRKLFTNSTIISLVLFVVAFSVAIFLMFNIPSSVKAPIAAFVDMADKISKGDTNGVVASQGPTEFQGLSTALDRLRIAQAGLVDRLRSRNA